MQDVFGILSIISVLVFIIGMVNPKLFTDKKTGKVADRKTLAIGSIALFVISVAFYAYFDESLLPPNKISVNKEEYGERWPLVADKATLHCELPDIAYIEIGGLAYALNGGALRAGFTRGDGIRSNSENVSMADFIERAMKICLDKRKEL
ncbi:MAG: DUF2511 domain-containing protein [Methylotenera sp.]